MAFLCAEDVRAVNGVGGRVERKLDNPGVETAALTLTSQREQNIETLLSPFRTPPATLANYVPPLGNWHVIRRALHGEDGGPCRPDAAVQAADQHYRWYMDIDRVVRSTSARQVATGADIRDVQSSRPTRQVLREAAWDNNENFHLSDGIS